jgi:repressor LexA
MSPSDTTPRQEEALQIIRDTFERLGRPPTIRELGEALGISSTNGVRYVLGKLEEKGWIVRSRRVSRGIRFTDEGRALYPAARHAGQSARPRDPARGTGVWNVVALPVVGRVAAGEPILAQQNIEEILQLDRSLFPYDEGTFALQVQGDSMVNAGILEGDLVVVRPDPRPANGTIAVAYWEGEATVKRFFRHGSRVVLRPENDAYEEIEIDPAQDDFRVLGRVVGVVRRI